MPIIIVFIFFWSMGAYMDLRELAVSNSSLWYTYITFNFVHISFIHLLVNSYVFIIYWKELRNIVNMKVFIPMMLIIPAISAYLSSSSIPTLGASAMIYVMTGIYIYVYRIKGKLLYKFLSVIFITFIVTFFFHNINTFIHVYSFIISLIVSFSLGRKMYGR